MSRYAWGVTLTPEERAQIAPASASHRGGGTTSAPSPQSYVCEVRMPDGTTCAVEYKRFGLRSHQFRFAEPIREKFWRETPSPTTPEAIEEQAQGLAAAAFQKAQEAEQKACRRASPPAGYKPDRNAPGAFMTAKHAAHFGGLYAVCVQLASGTLLRIGFPHTTPETACEELRTEQQKTSERGDNRRLVIGICCRWGRSWKLPQFLVLPPIPEATPPKPPRRPRRSKAKETPSETA